MQKIKREIDLLVYDMEYQQKYAIDAIVASIHGLYVYLYTLTFAAYHIAEEIARAIKQDGFVHAKQRAMHTAFMWVGREWDSRASDFVAYVHVIARNFKPI